MPQTANKQDLPPQGGYQTLRYKRNLPTKGFGGAVVFSAVAAVCTLGFWRYAAGNVEKRELQREKAWSRIYLLPFLTAEADRDRYRRTQAALLREREIMEDVEGWEAGKGVYGTKKYAPTSMVVT